MSGDPLGILTPKKSSASNDPLGILSTPKKEQPAIPGFMDIGGQTQQTIQTAQQKVPKVQQQPITKPKQETGVFDASVIGQEVKPTAPVNKGGLPIGVAVEQDKKIGGSAVGAIYNTLVDLFSEVGGGAAYVEQYNPLKVFAKSLKSKIDVALTPGAKPSDVLSGDLIKAPEPDKKREEAYGFVQKARSSSSTKEQEQERAAFDITDGLSGKDIEAFLFNIPKQLGGIGLGAGTGGLTWVLQSINDNAAELAANPNAKDLNNTEKNGYILGQALTQAAFEKFSLGLLFKSTGLGKAAQRKVLGEVMDEFAKKGQKATAKELEDAIFKKTSQFASKAKRVGLGTATGFVVEGTTEGTQTIAGESLKLLLNKIKGKEIFNEEDIEKNFFKNLSNSIAMGSAMGGPLGGLTAGFQNTNKSIRRQIAEANKPEDLQKVADDINAQVQEGNLSPQEAEQILTKAQEYTDIASKIPPETDTETKYSVIGGIEQRKQLENEIQKLEQEIQNVDPAFAKQKQDQLDLLKDKLSEVNDYIQEVVTGERNEYIEKDGKYIKITPDGSEVEITKGHYELSKAAQNETKRKAQSTVIMPGRLKQSDVTTTTQVEAKPETKKSTTTIILPKQNEIQETQVIQPKADEGTIAETESIEGRLPESQGEVKPITTETESSTETKPIEPIQEEPKAQPIEQPEQQTQQPTVSNPQPIKEEVSITTEPESQPIQQTEEGVENIPIQQEGVEAATQTEPKNLSTKARQYAAKLRSGEEKVLPDWLQASLPKGTKKQGIGINEAFAKALETFADIYDTTKDFAQAVDEGFQKIKDWFDENKIPYNEAELKEKFAQDRQGEIPTESQPPPPSEPPVSEQGEGKGFRHADTEKIRERSGLEPYQKIPETIQGWIDEARQRIKDGYNVEALLNRVEKGVMPDAVEQNIIGEYLMYLDEQVKANPSDENIAKLKRVVEISDKVGGSEIAKSLVARRGSRLPDDSLGNFFIQQMEATGANVLTENQKQVNTKEFEEIQAANNEYKEKVKILEEEVAKLKAQKEIDEVRKKSQPSKTKKTHEDYVKERQDIIKQMREDLLKVAKGSGGLQSSIPGAAQLKAIAPHVGKLVKSLVDENYTKLEEVVKLVYNEVKDIVEGITEKDIQNIIAGDYSEKKQTRSNLAANLRDLKTEAKLLGELEKLQNGVEPKVERQKQIRNKRITDLQNQIKELRKQQYVREKEFDKFYTEDLDAEFKKLAALRKRTESEIAKVEEKIKKGDFAPEERKPLLLNPELKKKYPEEFKKAVEAKDKLIKLKQEREIRLLKEKYANRTKYQKIQDAVVEVSNVPRAIMASVDFSAPLRQGIITTVAYPTISMKAAAEMFKQAFSQKAFDRWFYDVKEHPRYELAKKSTLHLADPHDPKLSAKEEQFMSNLAEKIPVIGRLVKGSERAYIAFLNKVRWDVFNRMADAYEAEGKTFENSEKLYRETGDYINTVTGRGTLGKFEESAQVLNAVFFSPRLIASRVKLLTNFANPNFYYNVPKEVRVQYFKDMAKFLGAGLSVLTLAKLYQEAFGSDEEDEKVTVEVDPRSSDFGKIKVGNTRYDIWGGFQPYVRLMAQMFTGQRKTTTTGEIQNLQPKQKFQTASNFFRGKLAPVPASGVDIITGENVTGDRVQPLEELTSMLIPLTFQDLSEAIKDKGVSAIFTTGIPSTFGVGTQTYTNISTLEGLYDRNLTSKQTMDINKITKYENGVKKPITKDEFKKFTQKRDSLIKSELDELYKNGKVYVKDGKPIKKTFADMTTVEVQDEIKKIKTNATKQAKEELFPVPLNIQIKEDIDQSLEQILNQ